MLLLLLLLLWVQKPVLVHLVSKHLAWRAHRHYIIAHDGTATSWLVYPLLEALVLPHPHDLGLYGLHA